MEQKWQIWDKLIFSPGMRNIGTHVHNFREVNSCCDFLVQSRRVLKPNRGKWIGGHPTTLLRTGWPKDRVQKMSPFQVEGQRQSFPYVQKKFKFYLFKWKEATTGSFCIVSCFVLSWWELHLLHLKLSIAHKINDNLLAFTWLSHLILDIEPRCSACVNLLRQKSKEMVEPSAIAGRSSEMSQKGSMVVETPLHTCHNAVVKVNVNLCRGALPHLTHHIWLEFSCEDCVHYAGAGGRDNARLVDQMPVQEVQGSDEELMGILLLVTSKMMGMGPDHVEELVRGKGGFVSRIELLEELWNLAHDALILLGCQAKMSIREEVIAEQRRVCQHLC